MIGKNQIVLGTDQFATGTASSAYSSDGVFAPSSYGLNPFVRPGAIYQTAAETDASTNVAGEFIASSEDSQAVSAQNRIFVDNAANYYFWNGSAISKKKTGTLTSHYIPGKTDQVSFVGNTYTTLDNDISQFNTSGSTSLDETWWTVTKSKSALDSTVPHPMLVFEGLLWVADGNNLHNIDSSLAITSNVLVLNSNERIYALGIDPSTGLMLISVQTTVNYSDTLTTKYFVYLYDGYASKPRRKIIVDDLVTAFYPLGGVVYVGYGTSIGYFNGVGIVFLRKLLNATLAGADLPYKHHFTHIGRVLYVIDGKVILAFGETVGGGDKKWFNIWSNPVSSQKLTNISHVGSGVLGIAFATSKFYTIDTTAVSGTPTSVDIFLNGIYFPRPVFVRKIRFITTGVTGLTSVAIAATLADENGNSSFASNASRFWAIPAATTRYVFDVDYAGAKMQGATLDFSMNSSIFGIVKIIVYYDVAE